MTYPLEKYARQIGKLFPNRDEHKKYLSCHHPGHFFKDQPPNNAINALVFSYCFWEITQNYAISIVRSLQYV